MKISRKLKISALVLAFLLLFYWVKCQLGINLIRHWTWEEHFPVLNWLQKRDVAIEPKPGELLLMATFDEPLPHVKWAGLWSRDKDMVEGDVKSCGIDNTKCMLITSQSAKDWSFSHTGVVSVNPGEVYSYSAWLKTTGQAKARLGLATYDADKKVINWVWMPAEDRTPPGVENGWNFVSRQVQAPEGAHSIRLRLTGEGVGTVAVDQVRFVREQ